MNIFSNTKNTKKFIFILVLFLLFNFCFPKNIHADEIYGGASINNNANGKYTTSDEDKEGQWFDIGTNFTKLLFLGERAIFSLLNNIFCDDVHQFVYGKDSDDNIVVDLSLTPESIIKGKFLLFNADIFEEIDTGENSEYFDGGAGKEDTRLGRQTLRETVAGWYYAIRNLAIVALLSVLVYVGIRMITSTISQDKAKYKVMFKDWLIALCLVVVMHYIMISILQMSSMVVKAIRTSSNSANSQTEVLMQKIGTITEAERSYTITTKTEDGKTKTYEDVRAVYKGDDDKFEFYDIGNALAFMLLLLVILIYTAIFAVKYLKREMTIIFLILLGPISCVTYPIDKISDGKAQAFNKWFYEFLYNVIIQPFHLLIYIVLVGSAIDLANDNLLYSIICFAVMIPAEKFIKEMFGFRDKLGSPLGAFAGGAVASQLFNKMKGGNSGGKSGGNNDDGGSSELPAKVKETKLPGAERDANDGIDTPDHPELDSPEGGSDDGVDAPDHPELDSPEGEGDDGVDAPDHPELDSPEEGSDDGVDTTDNSEDSPEEGSDEENSEDDNSTEDGENKEGKEKRGLKESWKKGKEAVKDKYNRRLLQKYGTTSKKELAKKRAWRMTKGMGRFAGRRIKGAVTFGARAAGAVALGTVGAMIGQGKAGAGLGIALGGKMGNFAGKQADKIASKTGDYTGTFSNAFSGKDTQKDKFMKNSNNIDRARRNFKERNDRKGSGKEIEQELEKMYEMQRHGVKDAFLDDAMDLYHKNKDENKMNDTDALNSAIISTIGIAQEFGPDKLRDPKAMQGVYDDYFARYKAAGVGDEKADELVRKLMNDGGSLRGVKNVALPPVRQKVTIPSANNLYGKLQFTNDREGQVQQEQVQAIQDVLVEVGLDNSQIQQVMEYSSGNTNAEIITSFAENVKYIVSNDIKGNSNIKVGEIKAGNFKQQIVKNETVVKENIERLDISKKTGITNETQISKMRELERKNGTTAFRAEGGKMIRGEYSKNDKNNLSEKALEMAEGYKRATTTKNPNTKRK